MLCSPKRDHISITVHGWKMCTNIISYILLYFQLGTVEGLPGGRHRNPITQKPDDALDRLAGCLVRAIHAQFRSRQHPGRLGRPASFGSDQAHRE